jgi:hypothetical protein
VHKGVKSQNLLKTKHKSSSIAYNIICKKQRDKKRVLASYTAISIFRNLQVKDILYEITTVSIAGILPGAKGCCKNVILCFFTLTF